MAATFEFDESNGAGQTITHNVSNQNWKNIDDTTTAYTAAPITAGNNSFSKWLACHFTGTYNNISNGRFAHTATAFGTGLTLRGEKSMAADADRLTYSTPATTIDNVNITPVDMTAVTAIGSGQAIWFGPTSANAAGKAASTASNPAFSNYMATQLQTTGSAGAGDTATVTLTAQYDEN